MSRGRRAICPRKAGGKCESNWATSSLSHRLQGPAREGRYYQVGVDDREELRRADANHIAFSSKQILVWNCMLIASGCPIEVVASHYISYQCITSSHRAFNHLIIAFMISLSGSRWAQVSCWTIWCSEIMVWKPLVRVNCYLPLTQDKLEVFVLMF
jgi:hypothetical protein